MGAQGSSTLLRADESAVHAGRDTPVVRPKQRPGGSSFWWWGAIGLACLLGVSSVLASMWVRSTVEKTSELRLERSAQRAASFFEERVRAYSEILRGTGALFRASEFVSPAEFRAYNESLNFQRTYPGLVGLGYAERVARTDLPRWLLATKEAGIDLQVVGSGNAPELVINKLVEPLALNKPALGFDAASEPERAAALEASARTRDLALTGRVHLRQDLSDEPGFVMYLPVSGKGDEERPVDGWVFASLRERNFLSELERASGAGVRVHLFDEAGAEPLFGPPPRTHGKYHRVEVHLADRTFWLEARPGPHFLSLSERTEPWAILILGLGATVLSFALTAAIRNTQARSRALAIRMTEALRHSEQELRLANQALERVAATDGLTGIANRRLFDQRLSEEVSRAQRNDVPLALIILDIDHFKLYNDTYGHPQGDECLKRVGACLNGLVRRAGELAARYGGEEFALILPGSDPRTADEIAETVRQSIEELALVHHQNAPGVVTASVGVANFDRRRMGDSTDLVAAADSALYTAKQMGRNRIARGGVL